MADKIDPSVPSRDYQANAADFNVLRTVMAGTTAMRNAGETYLPKHPAEEQDAYNARLAETVLTNRLEGAVRNAVGKPMSDPVSLEGEYDPYYDTFIDDVDFLGNSLDVFARTTFEDGVTTGLVFIMVDMPVAEPGLTLADEIAKNIRPYFIHYAAEDVLSCTIHVGTGRPQVVDARFREATTKVVGFEEVPVRRVRHWRKDGWDLWEMKTDDKGKETEWGIIQSGANLLNEVALVPIFMGQRASKTGLRVKAPFLDLAWKNVEHWQSSSDQRHILKWSRFPILAGSGVKMPRRKEGDEAPVIGPHVLLTTEDPSGKWYYVEPNGAGIASGEKDLERLEAEMAALAMKPHLKNTGYMTATGVMAGESRENSAIKNMALNMKDGLERAFVFAERLRGAADTTRAPSVSVSTDYSDEYNEDGSADWLLKARIAGEISRETFWSEMKRRGHLSVTFKADEETVRLEADGTGMNAETDDDTEDDANPIEPAKTSEAA